MCRGILRNILVQLNRLGQHHTAFNKSLQFSAAPLPFGAQIAPTILTGGEIGLSLSIATTQTHLFDH